MLRDGFVAVKVDREERPDVDAAYMSATTALTGQGGWPMTCLLTPSGEPFWAGTYLPRDHFLHLLRTASDQWEQDRARLEQGAGQIASALQGAHARAASTHAGRDRPRPGRGRGDSGHRARPAVGRFRGGTEVPPVDGARLPAAPPRPHRRRAGAAHGPVHR
ncbi:MAG: hypothetical protein DI571_08015 [Arsenicicoccus sp.]|nr:MAG: hypothetical protein DI571_08015 [Arsenicicoccus sp.]